MKVFVSMQLFTVLFLLSNVSVVTAVAGCLYDRDTDDRPRVNCSSAGFSAVPQGLEPSTKVVLLGNNLFSSLPWTSFQTFQDIYEIDLTANKVTDVVASITPLLPTLSILRLGSNQLRSLSFDSFSASPALTALFLEKNIINYLSDYSFSGLSKLKKLDLSFNQISVLPERLLHPLPAIETIYLENNKIWLMPDDWFSKKQDVPYLFLSANPWVCSCSLNYLRSYLNDYPGNIYVRDGIITTRDEESVVCDSPWWLKGRTVIDLTEDDLCIPPTNVGSRPPTAPAPITTIPITTIPTTTTTPTTTIPTTTTTPTTTIPTTTTTPTTTIPTTTTTPTTTIPTTTIPTTTIPTTTTPTTTTSTTTTPTTTPATTPSPTTPANIELFSEYDSGWWTWSWYQSTNLIEGPEYATPSTIRPSTEPAPSVVTPTRPELQLVQTTTATPSWVIHDGGSRRRGKVVGGTALFCFWLFAGCLLLCVASAACILVTLARLVIWYRKLYRPLSAMLASRRAGSKGGRLLMHSRGGGKAAAAGGGVTALYRSVLFIHREGGEAVDGEDGGKGGEGIDAGKDRLVVALEPARGGMAGEEDGQRQGRGDKGMYKKTMYQLLSKEEEIEGWRDVLDECRGGVANEGETSGGGASRKRYSVILREERGGEAAGGKEELDWVVGGWEVKGGKEEPRSSWGQWLEQYLPSMPFRVTTPPEGEAAPGASNGSG